MGLELEELRGFLFVLEFEGLVLALELDAVGFLYQKLLQ